MKLSKTHVIVLLTLTTAAGSMLAWRQYGELVELRAAAMNRSERADLQKRIWDLEKANRELQDQLAANRDLGEVDELLAGAAGGQPAQTRERSTREREGRGERGERGGDSRGRGGFQQAAAVRELMSKPEVQAMVNLQLKAGIESRYATLFKNLNLPVEQIDRLKTLLADRTTTMQDVMAAAREQGINPRENPEAFRKIVADAQDQINNSIKAVIGDQGFAQLTNYEQTMPQRNLVNELQQRLSYTSTPLTPAQADQMVQILAANTPQRSPGTSGVRGTTSGGMSPGRGGPPVGIVGRGGDFSIVAGGMPNFPGGMMGGFDGGRGGVPVTSAAVAQSQTVLAPPQVAALQEIQQLQQTQQQLRQLVNETLTANQPARSGNSPGNASSPATGSAPGTKSGRRGGG